MPVSEDKLTGAKIGSQCCVLVTGVTSMLRMNSFSSSPILVSL